MKLSATFGSATLVAAVMAVGNSVSAQTVTLQTLLAAGSITSGNLTFSGFTESGGASLTIDPSQIYVTAVTGGIDITCSMWVLNASSSYNLSLGYNVTTTDGSFINGLAANLSGTYNQGEAFVVGTAKTGGGSTLGNSLVYLDYGYSGSSVTNNSISFAQQSGVTVNNGLTMSTSGAGGATMVVNGFADTFTTTVPEPSAMAMGLLGSVGGFGLFLLRRRN